MATNCILTQVYVDPGLTQGAIAALDYHTDTAVYSIRYCNTFNITYTGTFSVVVLLFLK